MWSPEKLTCQVFKEKNDKFVISSLISPDMNKELCSTHCRKVDAAYMALSRGNKCICSNQYGMETVEPPSSCGRPCAGDPTDQCGGNSSALFYRIGDTTLLVRALFVTIVIAR